MTDNKSHWQLTDDIETLVAELVATDDDTEYDALMSKLEEAYADLDSKHDGYHAVIKHCERKSFAIDGEISFLKMELAAAEKRKEREAKVISKLKDRIREYMLSTGETKIDRGVFKFQLNKMPQKVVVDMDTFDYQDKEFTTIKPAQYNPDKVAIRKALKEGRDPMGCSMSEVEYKLVIK